MALVKIESPTPWRILNIGRKSYTFNKDCICFIPEDEISTLPSSYRNLWAIIDESVEEIEIQKIVEEPKQDIKKIIEKPKQDIKKVIEKPDIKK